MDSPLTHLSPPADPFRLLLGRHSVLLGLLALSLAWVCLWVLLPVAFLPWSGTVHSSLLPQVLTGVLLGGAALLAPFMLCAEALPRRIARAGYVSLWIASIELFALLVSSRLVPLETPFILAVSVLLGGFAFTFQTMAAAFPRAFSGVIFAWLIGLPVLAYFSAEIVMMIPGTSQWLVDGGGIHGWVRWMLHLSPSTFVMAVLNGIQADGSEVACWGPLAAFTALPLISILVLARRKVGVEHVSVINASACTEAGPAP